MPCCAICGTYCGWMGYLLWRSKRPLCVATATEGAAERSRKRRTEPERGKAYFRALKTAAKPVRTPPSAVRIRATSVGFNGFLARFGVTLRCFVIRKSPPFCNARKISPGVAALGLMFPPLPRLSCAASFAGQQRCTEGAELVFQYLASQSARPPALACPPCPTLPALPSHPPTCRLPK